jgi:ABC-type transport system involved in multi-copper enzyme maturation permease subunit
VRRRFLLLFLLVAWIHPVLRAVQVALLTRLPEFRELARLDASLFGDFLGLQTYFALFLSALAGAGLVAEDLRTGGILLYLSRSLSRRDYALGKLGVLVALNLGVTLVPALVLYAASLGLAPDTFLKLALAWLPLAILAQGTVVTTILSLLALAASSLTRRAWVAGLGLVTTLMILDLVVATLRQVLDWPAADVLSPLGALRLLSGALFGREHAWGNGVAALVALAALALLSLLVLRWRVRAVEVVR